MPKQSMTHQTAPRKTKGEINVFLNLLRNLNSVDKNNATGKWPIYIVGQVILNAMLKKASRLRCKSIETKVKKPTGNNQPSTDSLQTINMPLSSAEAYEIKGDQ